MQLAKAVCHDQGQPICSQQRSSQIIMKISVKRLKYFGKKIKIFFDNPLTSHRLFFLSPWFAVSWFSKRVPVRQGGREKLSLWLFLILDTLIPPMHYVLKVK